MVNFSSFFAFFGGIRVQKKGSAASGAAREKIAGLQEHASKVEDLLKSMQVNTETRGKPLVFLFIKTYRLPACG